MAARKTTKRTGITPPVPAPAGEVWLQYPANSDDPNALGLVRAEHVDTYLAAGFRLTNDSEGE